MSLNKLKLNSEKTELLVIGSGNLSVSQLPSFTAMDGSVIQHSHSARNIGVIFDNKLKYGTSSFCYLQICIHIHAQACNILFIYIESFRATLRRD